MKFVISMFKALRQNLINFLTGCGEIGKGSENRITGGQVTRPNAYPWQALVLIEPRLCGGSILNDFYILTAGHCVAP